MQPRDLTDFDPYFISLDERAWRQIGALPRNVFNQVRDHLDLVADSASDAEPGAPRRELRRVDLGEFVMRYELAHGDRVVTLIEVVKVDCGPAKAANE